MSVNGTNYTLQTAATKWWKVLSNVYQRHRCGGITDQNLMQIFSFTHMLKQVLCLNNEIENFIWINKNRSVHVRIVLSIIFKVLKC